MVGREQKDIDLDSTGNRINYGSGPDKIVRDFIRSKQSRAYRTTIGTLRVLAISAVVSCILLTPLILRILYEVSEVTQSTNQIVKPLLDEDQEEFSKHIINDMNQRHQKQLKAFHDDPAAFDLYMKERKL